MAALNFYIFLALTGIVAINLAGILVSVIHTNSSLANFKKDDLVFESNVTFLGDVCFTDVVFVNSLNVTDFINIEGELMIVNSTINNISANCTTIENSINITENFIFDNWNTSDINTTFIDTQDITCDRLTVTSSSDISGQATFNNTSLDGDLQFSDLSQNSSLIFTLENGTLNTAGTIDSGTWSPNIVVISGASGTPSTTVTLFQRYGNIVYGHFNVLSLSSVAGASVVLHAELPINKINANGFVFGEYRVFEASASNLNGGWIANLNPPSTTQLSLRHITQTSGTMIIFCGFTYSLV